MSPMLPDNNLISRTATDALLAKFSSIITAGYSPLSHSNHPYIGIVDKLDKHTSSLSRKLNKVSKYRALLQSMTDFYVGLNTKRQNPLINAGYAVRVACVLRQVESFVAFHRHCNTNCAVQIIIPGCGLDVTGLWSFSLVDETDLLTSPGFGIHVVEIDFPIICDSKKRAIQTMNLLDHRDRDISLPMYANCSVSKTNDNLRYSLVSANLEDTSLMDEVFSDPLLFDTSLPTLVLSELVLAYLSTECREQLLHRMATLFRCRGSCTTMYEPLGPTLPLNAFSDSKADSESTLTPTPVLESYKSSYCNMFNGRLRKGLASKQQHARLTVSHENNTFEEDPNSHSFNPLGWSSKDIIACLHRLGYEYVYASIAGRVASSLQLIDWKARELFDEHAALTLHLYSYIAVCAFPKVSETDPSAKMLSFTENVDNFLFRRFMCPWISNVGLMKCPIPIKVPSVSALNLRNHAMSRCWLACIEKYDEKQTRLLFSDTYKCLFESYPSIRKMVKTALRSDLGASIGDVPSSCNSEDYTGTSSIIGKRYQDLGGDFIVAVQYNHSSSAREHVSSSDGDISMRNDHKAFREVLGAIGIRKCTFEECVARSIPSNADCFEIHRFFVDVKYRYLGIGTVLFSQVLDAIHRRQCHTFGKICYVIATTPTILVSATSFYTKQGFDIQNEIETGGLTIRTYLKRL